MTMLAGAVFFNEKNSSRSVAENIARETACYEGLHKQILYDNNGITLFAIEQHIENLAKPIFNQTNNREYWILGDVNYLLKERRPEEENLSSSIAELSNAKIPGRWLGVEVNSETGLLRFATDRLGLAWLYIAKTSRGYIFSSDFAAVARIIGSALTVDIDTVLLELALGYALDEKTIYNEIQLLPPGSLVELRPSGIKIIKNVKVQYGDRYVSLSTKQKYDQLDEIFDSIIHKNIHSLTSQLITAISAGYDSRYALAFLEKYNIPTELCTFGIQESDEVQGAIFVCSKIERSTNIFSFEEADWAQWCYTIQSLGNVGITQWSGWAESWFQFLKKHGKVVSIGYLGDALTGKHLGKIERSEAGWLSFWQKWSTEEGWIESPLLSSQAKNQLRDCLPTHLGKMAKEASIILPHQRALHLDLYGRQRRWVATQPNLISRFLTPSLFFYDDDLINFWANLPITDLLGQKLYLSYAHSRFPHLFPKGEGRPQNLTRRAFRKIARSLRVVVNDEPNKPKPPVIDHHAIINPNKKQILELTERVSPLIENILDLASFCEQVKSYGQSQTIPSWHILRAVNLFLLLDLRK